jgi:hypothetical protein
MKMSLRDRKKYLNLIKIVNKLKPEERSQIVPYLKTDCVEFLCECVHNVLYTDIGIKNKNKIKQKLKNQCSVHRLKTIASKSKSIAAKTSALKQEGKGLGLILSAALPFLMNLFTGR